MNSEKVRNIRGRIAYLRHGGQTAGREFFSVSVFPDGTRTLRAECHFDIEDLVRDVIFTLDRRWQPIDAYLRVAQSRRFLGSGWYRFDDGGTTCEALDSHQQHVTHVKNAVRRPPSFGSHPIINDGIWPAVFDLSRADSMQRFDGCITYSKEQIGKESIGIDTFDLEITYHGMQTIQVAAGSFDCRHFEALIVGLAAPFKLWTWSDDYIVVKETWAELPGHSYELAELQFPIPGESSKTT